MEEEIINKIDSEKKLQKTKQKKLSELNLCDDFLFSKTMRDPDILKPVLEIILKIKIARIEIVEMEKTIDVSYNAHGVRLDVYADDKENRRFAIEMQAQPKYNIPERSRYYHSLMDIDELEKGQDYKELKDNYVIFICTYDLFGKGLHRYNFRYKCSQVQDLTLEDGTETIILNTKGTGKDVSEDLLAFLKYVESSTDETAAKFDNQLVNKLHEKVKEIKQSRSLEVEYLKFEELMRESHDEGFSAGLELGRSEGLTEGLNKGENRFAKLISRLIEDNRSEDIKLAINDENIRMKFYIEYGLIDKSNKTESHKSV